MFSLNKLSPSITDMIRFDHSHVMVTWHQYTSSSRDNVKKALADTICDALEIHATLEEEVFYPVIRRLNPNEPVIQKSEPEHDEMRRMIAELRDTKPTEDRHDALLHELMRDVMHHVADEETTLLPDAERLLGEEELQELGARMTRRRIELAAPRSGEIAANMVRAVPAGKMLAVTGAVIAGGLIARRAFGARTHH